MFQSTSRRCRPDVGRKSGGVEAAAARTGPEAPGRMLADGFGAPTRTLQRPDQDGPGSIFM